LNNTNIKSHYHYAFSLKIPLDKNLLLLLTGSATIEIIKKYIENKGQQLSGKRRKKNSPS